MTSGKIISIGLAVLVLGFAGPAKARTVEFNLFNLGCPSTFNHDSPHWQTNFNLGFPANQISNVYIDLSGAFTAGLAAYNNDPCNPFPMDVSLMTELMTGPTSYSVRISGGESTYPAPESFAAVSELFNVGSWLPEEPYIDLRYGELIPFTGRLAHSIEHGSLTVNRATLIIEGTFVPEPATLLLLGLGSLALLRKRRS